MDGINEDLRFELQSMQTRDQTLRHKLYVHGSFTFTQEEARMCEFVDRVNTERMKEIVAQYGWPGYRLVGQEGGEIALLIVLHADRDVEFQVQCLERIRGAVAAGDASARQLCFLEDRIRVNQNRPQLYGTQMKLSEGLWTFAEIEDTAGVNERRFAMGLPPLGPLS